MNAHEVGLFRFCPACGRDAVPPDHGSRLCDDWEAWRCSCCDRPWGACPCTPAADGPCRAGLEIRRVEARVVDGRVVFAEPVVMTSGQAVEFTVTLG